MATNGQKYIAGAIKGLENIKQQLTGYEDRISLIRINEERIKPYCSPVVTTRRTEDGTGFILSSDTRGVLGTNLLGFNHTGNEIIRIVNTEDTYIERLLHLDFIDTTNTTASINLTEQSVYFEEDQELVSKLIYKNTPIKRVLFTMPLEMGNLEEFGFYVKGTESDGWVRVELGEWKQLNEPTSQLQYKIKLTGDESAFPTPFGEWGNYVLPSTLHFTSQPITGEQLHLKLSYSEEL